MEYEIVHSQKHIHFRPCPLIGLIVRCQTLLKSANTRILYGNRWELKSRSFRAPLPFLWRPVIGGMDLRKLMLRRRLCTFLEWNPDRGYWEEEKERRRDRRVGVGSRRGCEASGSKWDFLLFIYLAELIAQGCLFAFCLYVLWPLCPLPHPPFPLSVCIWKCKYVHLQLQLSFLKSA